MGPFQRAVELYPYVFHPITVLGAGILLIVRHEWLARSPGRDALWRRAAAFLGAGVLGLVPTAAYFLLRSGTFSRALGGKSWRIDLLVAAGVLIAAGVTWFLWRHYRWGEVVPDAMVVLAAVTVPYAVLSPFWDVSGHVLLALAPTLYLALLDRTYAPLLAIPILMVPNRVLVDAHTWTQSIVGFLLAGVITVGLYRYRSRAREERPTGSTPQ